jgi:Tfp pilus assembly pilus retraction ATPase PilT
MTFSSILQQSIRMKASDLQLSPGLLPYVRKADQTQPVLNFEPLEAEALEAILLQLMTKEQHSYFKKRKQIQFLRSGQNYQLRITASRIVSEVHLSIRIFPGHPLDIEKAGYPKELRELAKSRNGLIVIGGKKCSGRSTMARAMLSTRKNAQIISISPFSEVNWGETSKHILQHSYLMDGVDMEEAIRMGLNQNPDIMSIEGDVKQGSLNALLQASIHAQVILEMAAIDETDVIHKLISLLPERIEERSFFASRLRAIAIPKLHYDKAGTMCPLLSLLIFNKSCREALVERKYTEVISLLNRGEAGSGSQDIDVQLERLIRTGEMSIEEASPYARDASIIRTRSMGIFHTE